MPGPCGSLLPTQPRLTAVLCAPALGNCDTKCHHSKPKGTPLPAPTPRPEKVRGVWDCGSFSNIYRCYGSALFPHHLPTVPGPGPLHVHVHDRATGPGPPQACSSRCKAEEEWHARGSTRCGGRARRLRHHRQSSRPGGRRCSTVHSRPRLPACRPWQGSTHRRGRTRCWGSSRTARRSSLRGRGPCRAHTRLRCGWLRSSGTCLRPVAAVRVNRAQRKLFMLAAALVLRYPAEREAHAALGILAVTHAADSATRAWPQGALRYAEACCSKVCSKARFEDLLTLNARATHGCFSILS